MFTGILQAVDNTEQLAAVLAHEMAHVVLSHAVSTRCTQLGNFSLDLTAYDSRVRQLL